LEQVAVEHLARLHRTYSRWADTNGDLMGSLLLKLTVDARKSGQCRFISFTRNEYHLCENRHRRCSQMEIPKAGVEAAEITVPLLFVPKGMDPETVVQWNARSEALRKAKRPTGTACRH
jgi:hypothetical protein